MDRPTRTSPLAGRVFLVMTSAALILVLWFALRTIYQTGQTLSAPDTIWNLTQRARRVPALPDDESVSVSLEHFSCEPSCAAWTATLFASGRTTYQGVVAACGAGTREGSADREVIGRIVAGLERIDFDRLAVAPPGDDPARALAELRLARGANLRSLRFALDDASAPKVLGAIAVRIEAAAGVPQC